MNVSVAMAVYNGAEYIEEQLISILKQLGDTDELIISYDLSKDRTWEIISGYAQNDTRIVVLKNQNPGVLGNFQNALTHCNNEIVFLSDQDDLWIENKVDLVKKTFQAHPNAKLIMHDCTICDQSLETISPSFFAYRNVKRGFLQNLIKNSFIGCCMAVRKELLMEALPFPADIPMHDQWLGLLAERKDSVVFLDTPLLKYRRHGANVSSTEHSSFMQMMKWRYRLIKALHRRGVL